MNAKEMNDENSEEEPLPLWRHRYPYSFILCWPFISLYRKTHRTIVIVFATWPSMHDPIRSLLNVKEADLADKLTAKWTEAKLGELQYVGLTVREWVN